MSRKNKHRDPMGQQPVENQTEDEMPTSAAEAEEAPTKETIDFDGWWAMRATRIPSQHHKEVVKADFRGRGLSTKETMEDYDIALSKYGVKLQ